MVMRRNARIGAAVAVAALVILAGCGSSSGSSSSSSTTTSAVTGGSASGSGKQQIDVCKIITPADAEKVVGGPVEAQASAGSEGLTSGVCIYKGTGGGIAVKLLQIR